MKQKPIQRWLVLTEFGVELQPLGNYGSVQKFAEAIKPYRRLCTIVNEETYRRAYCLRRVRKTNDGGPT